MADVKALANELNQMILEGKTIEEKFYYNN